MENSANKPTVRIPTTLLSLPTHLIEEILSRLPPKALFNCKRTCKQLLSLILDPQFAHLHRSRSRPHLLYHYHYSYSNSFSLFDLHADKSPAELRVPDFGHGDGTVYLRNSCNGLLCVDRVWCIEFVVCNPILGEFIILPELTNQDTVRLVAIGFCPNQKQFKVLCVIMHKEGIPEARIYTIGSAFASWRTIGPAPDSYAWRNWIDTFVNGVMHWFDHEQGSPVIRAFDFDTEKFRVLRLSEKMDIRPWMQVGAFEGCLVVSSVSDILSHQADVWIMKEYGVEESWTKLYSVVDKLAYSDTPQRIVRPFKVLDGDGEALVMSYDRFVNYDVKNSSSCHLEGLPLALIRERQVPAVSPIPSLVSLRHIANQERVYVY